MPAFDYGYNGGQSSPVNPGYTVPKTKANTMPSGNQRAEYEKAMADRYANTVVSPGIFGTTIGQQKGYTGQGAAGGRSPSLASSNNSGGGGGGGGLSFSTGRGGQYSSVPSNVLNTRQFAPYESTYTPPTPATPDPYNYATRDPYTYGEGLSNAGAAYDIWGSKPGTNPYRLTTPADYTPGILGLDPITLPGNMNNKGADISSLSNVKQKDSRTPAQQQWDRIAAYASQEALPKQELKMASDQYAARYGNEIFNNDKANLAKMFPKTNWDNFATPELRAANQVKYTAPMAANKTLAAKAAAPTPVAPTGQITSKMDRDYSTPAKTYTAKKSSTKAAVAKYNSTAKSGYKIDMAPKAGTYGGRPRL